MKALIAVALVALPGAAAAQALDLHLVCRGGGASNIGSGNEIVSRNNTTGETVTTSVDGPAVGFADEVRIDIAGQGGRIRLPHALMPAIRGGKDGWFDLRKVAATPDEITAVATINLFNKIKLRLDRITGTASFTTLNGSFQGRCIPFRPDETPRAF